MKLQIKIITFKIFICFATISTVASGNNNSSSSLTSIKTSTTESTTIISTIKTEIPPTTSTIPTAPKMSSIFNTLLSITKFLTNSFNNSNKKQESTKNQVQEKSLLHKTNSSITKRNPEELDDLICPTERQAKFHLFAQACEINKDCKEKGLNFRCCKLFGSNRCIEGVERPIEDVLDHEPLFGVPRKCPKEPLAETFWAVQSCNEDTDCDFPRICCPSGRERYCLHSHIEVEDIPIGRQYIYPVESFSKYFQCTEPPPKIFDLYPKECKTTLDCIPNMCCLENGKRHCRPPKKSLLSLLTVYSQRFNVGFIKDITDNLVIRR